MTTTDKDQNAENTGTTNASGVTETPATPQLEQMAFVGEPSPPAKHRGGRPRKSRSNPDLTADPTWVIYQCQGAPREGHVVREYREDGRDDGLLVVNNVFGYVVLLASEEWRCWYRPAFVNADMGIKPRNPLQEATVRAPSREQSWVSADGAPSENPTPRKRTRRQGMDANEQEIARRLEAGEFDNVAAPKLSPLDWLNLRYAAENFRAACEGENEPEARRLLTLLRGVANHVWPAV